MNIPPQTGQIFHLLSQGVFLSQDSFSTQKALFDITSQFQQELSDYFRPLGFELLAGEGFFYFSSSQEANQSGENIESAIKLIELLDFFKTYTSVFGAGYVFTLEEVYEKCLNQNHLRRKLDQINVRGGQGKEIEKIRQAVRILEKQGFVELIHEPTEKYHVLAAFSFLEAWAQKIELI